MRPLALPLLLSLGAAPPGSAAGRLLQTRQRSEGDGFVALPLTRVARPGWPSVYAATIDLSGDLASLPTTYLVDSGSSALVVEPLPTPAALDVPSGLWTAAAPPSWSSKTLALASTARGVSRTAARWTIHYEGTSLTGTTQHGKVCVGKKPTQACTGDGFAFFQADADDAEFQGAVSRKEHGIVGLAPQASAADSDHSIGIGLLEALQQSGAISRRAFGFAAESRQGPPALHLGGWDASRANGAQFFDLAQPSRGKWEIPVDDLALVPPEVVTLPGDEDVKPARGAASGPRAMGLCPGGGCRALIDTGTSLLEASEEATQALQQAVPVRPDCSNVDDLPSLRVAFPGGSTFTVEARDYVVRIMGVCQLGVQAIRKAHWTSDGPQPMDPPMLILGQAFLRRHYAIFDADGGRVGFAPSTD